MRIVTSFSRNKYETTVTTVRSGEIFSFPSVHTDTYIRSNQIPDWRHVIHCAMTQLSIKSDMKIFGTRGVDAMPNEIK